ncbi:hypothetical protein BKE38_09425 [Pseudoroseomonas deserti]|uniref:DUF1579 domain-containing protein n=2 Tax=Teichococcus deserti TaxID=1817963 RepID=A0A1V2H3J3_9PROT|nr:hypothetical protein BKE38_09425 [Pseudoroseomonas deserti]
MAPSITDQHRWLLQFQGEWHMVADCAAPPGGEPVHFEGRETVRALGEAWIHCEGIGPGPTPESEARSVMLLGYDTAKGCFVGTFTGSMMTNLWIYQGQLDADRRMLTLDTEGPNFGPEGGTAKFQDIIALEADGGRSMTSRMQKPDGRWEQVMRAVYRRI